MDGDDFIDPTPDNPAEAARFLSFLDLTPILSVLEGFYCEPWRHRHSPEVMLRLYALHRLKRCRFLTDLWIQLEASYKTFWHRLNVRVKAEGLIPAVGEGSILKQISLFLFRQCTEPSKKYIRNRYIIRAKTL